MAERDYLPIPGGYYDTATRRWVTPEQQREQVTNSAFGGGMDPGVAEYMRLLGGDPNYLNEEPPQAPPPMNGRVNIPGIPTPFGKTPRVKFSIPAQILDAIAGGVADTPMPSGLSGGEGFAAGLQGAELEHQHAEDAEGGDEHGRAEAAEALLPALELAARGPARAGRPVELVARRAITAFVTRSVLWPV